MEAIESDEPLANKIRRYNKNQNTPIFEGSSTSSSVEYRRTDDEIVYHVGFLQAVKPTSTEEENTFYGKK